MKLIHWLLLMLLVIVLPVFSHMDDPPIQLWDESRLAMSAYEMSQSGNLLVPTFQHEPDMWSLKPPFMIWCMALSVKVFGVNELALRLPGAIAAVLTCLSLFFFVNRVTRNARWAMLTCLVLVTSYGYVRLHSFKKGDYDGMLTLFTTAYFIAYYLYLKENKAKYLYFFFLALLLATMTKGIAAFLFLPGLFVYTVFAKKIRVILFNRHFYIGMLIFIIPVLSYYIIREQYNPGYLQAVSVNELLGRYTNVLEQHSGPWNFYIDFMHTVTYRYWLLPLAVSVILFFVRYKKEQLLVGYTFTVSLFFLIIISASKTKLMWYDVPVYPLFAILVAMLIDKIFEAMFTNTKVNKVIKIGLVSCVILLIGVQYINTFDYVSHPVKDVDMDDNQYMALYMKEAKSGMRNITGSVFTDDTRQDQNILFYYDVLKKEKKLQCKELNEIRENDSVIVFKESTENYLKQNYELKLLESFENVKRYKILSVQSDTTAQHALSSNQ